MKKTAFIVVGLSFGDEGKGSMTDFLCRFSGATLVVRYNGGSQAAHNVITAGGQHHTFSQLGSGSFIPEVKTLISRFMLWDPFLLAFELADFRDKISSSIVSRHFIDARAPVITPFHMAANQIREWSRGKERYGSCGKGVGETAYDLVHFPGEVLRASQLNHVSTTIPVLRAIQARKRCEFEDVHLDVRDVPAALEPMARRLLAPDEPERVASAYEKIAPLLNIVSEAEAAEMVRNETSVFEGAQGVLLDEWYGFHPYTTWSTTTQRNALMLLKEAGFDGQKETIGVIRSYATRHGSGPFVTEDPGMQGIYPGEHNGLNDWQRDFRIGAFDEVLLRYALDCVRSAGKLDAITLTHLDVFGRQKEVPFCGEYEIPPDFRDGMFKGFEMRNGRYFASRLVFERTQNLHRQSLLTDNLFRSRASLSRPFTSPDDLVGFVEGVSGVPVSYRSFGPRADQKYALEAIEKEL